MTKIKPETNDKTTARILMASRKPEKPPDDDTDKELSL